MPGMSAINACAAARGRRQGRRWPAPLASLAWLCLAGCVGFGPAASATPAPPDPPAPVRPDYSNAANWVCAPGSDSVCRTGLDVRVVQPDGSSTVRRFRPAASPPIDCFYLYPTVSTERAAYAGLTNDPVIRAVTRAQAGRLSSVCRVLAPLYRQATRYFYRQLAIGHPLPPTPYAKEDVEAAWAYYMGHYNHGRGVVLIGHSQGAIRLQDLIATAIDGKPAQALLVAAFLAGDPSLAVPPGAVVGGTFAHVPTCSTAAQTGCAYAWGDYLAGSADERPPVFGRALGNGLASACDHPSAPGSGIGMLDWYEGRPPTAPASDPPFVEYVGAVTGTCRSRNGANIFVDTVLPGPRSAYLRSVLAARETIPGWGIHGEDIGLAQGNIIDVIEAEAAAWKRSHP